MKKLFLLSTALVIALLTGLTSCSKYEEGPSLSLLTKTSRLAGVWKVEFQSVAGIEVSINDIADMTMTVEKDGTGEYSYKSLGITMTFDMEWEWVDGKEEIRIKVAGDEWYGSNDWETYKVLKLENKELWISSTETGIETITHFIPAE